jgi:hypothetical protein
MEPKVKAFRAFVFLVLAASTLGVGAFIGGAIAQPALLEMLPWHQASGQKI